MSNQVPVHKIGRKIFLPLLLVFVVLFSYVGYQYYLQFKNQQRLKEIEKYELELVEEAKEKGRELYNQGFRGMIILINKSLIHFPDFIDGFTESGGSILYPQSSMGTNIHNKQDLENANFLAEAYTTNVTVRNWYWIPRAGFNKDNVILVLVRVNDEVWSDKYSRMYPSFGTLNTIYLRARDLRE